MGCWFGGKEDRRSGGNEVWPSERGEAEGPVEEDGSVEAAIRIRG